MFTINDLLWGVALPCGVSLILLAIFGGWRWGVTLSLAAAYIAGHIALDGLPGAAAPEGAGMVESLRSLRPHEALDWAVFAALAATVVGVFVSCNCVSPGAVGLGRLLLAFGLVNAVLWPIVQGQWDKVQALVYIQSIIAIALVIWWSLDALADRARGANVPLILTLTVTAAAMLTGLEGSERLGKLTLVLAATLFGAFLAGLFRGSLDVSRGGMAVIVSVTTALLLAAAFYLPAYPLWAAFVIALAPTLAWTLRTGPLRRMSPIKATILAAVLVLIPLIAAVGPSAWALYSESQSAPTEYE